MVSTAERLKKAQRQLTCAREETTDQHLMVRLQDLIGEISTLLVDVEDGFVST